MSGIGEWRPMGASWELFSIPLPCLKLPCGKTDGVMREESLKASPLNFNLGRLRLIRFSCCRSAFRTRSDLRSSLHFAVHAHSGRYPGLRIDTHQGTETRHNREHHGGGAGVGQARAPLQCSEPLRVVRFRAVSTWLCSADRGGGMGRLGVDRHRLQIPGACLACGRRVIDDEPQAFQG